MVVPVPVVLGASPSFAAVAGGVAAATRSSQLRRGWVVLLGMGLVWLPLVALLWLDGRSGRYFAPTFRLIVAVGAAVGADRVGAPVATPGWTVVFAAAFASGLAFDVSAGSAAVWAIPSRR
jgi:CTP:molybdopterin cytidylyltransferase MocA